MHKELIDILRASEENEWVADQLERTLAQGISMTVKDSKGDAEFYRLEPSGLTARERKKRETYETTRAYTDDESLELVKDALRSLYVTLPAIQSGALKELHDLGLDFSDIKFEAPDEPGREDAPHTLSSNSRRFSKEAAEGRLQAFFERTPE